MFRSVIQEAVVQKEKEIGKINTKSDIDFFTFDEISSKAHISSNGMAVLLFSGYMIIGGCYYTLVEDNTPLESVYFSMTTLMTIGYGDMPVHNFSFAIFFVFVGAGVVGTILGLVSFRAMEKQDTLLNLRFNSLARTFGIEDGVDDKSTEKDAKKENSPLKSMSSKARDIISKAFKKKKKTEDLKVIHESYIAAYDKEIHDLKMITVVNFCLFLLTFFLGAVCMRELEGWEFTKAAYWVNNRHNICLLHINEFIRVCLLIRIYEFV